MTPRPPFMEYVRFHSLDISALNLRPIEATPQSEAERDTNEQQYQAAD